VTLLANRLRILDFTDWSTSDASTAIGAWLTDQYQIMLKMAHQLAGHWLIALGSTTFYLLLAVGQGSRVGAGRAMFLCARGRALPGPRAGRSPPPGTD
jgi:hypothetical protein